MGGGTLRENNLNFYLCISSVSLLEGSLSGVEALRHLRLDLQSRKKASVQSLFNKLSSF